MTGEQIIISNGDLLKSRVRNYSRLSERRAELQLRIAYETPRELIARAAEDHRGGNRRRAERALRARAFRALRRLRAAVRGDLHGRGERLRRFMDAQQAINLRLLDEFARRGIKLAYPTTRSLNIAARHARRADARSGSARRRFDREQQTWRRRPAGGEFGAGSECAIRSPRRGQRRGNRSAPRPRPCRRPRRYVAMPALTLGHSSGS